MTDRNDVTHDPPPGARNDRDVGRRDRERSRESGREPGRERARGRARGRGREVSRRELFRLVFGGGAVEALATSAPGASGDARPGSIGASGEAVNRTPPPRSGPTVRRVLRPPGAKGETAFLDACDACHGCVDACPYDAIRVADDDTPWIDPSRVPCVSCIDVPCSRACPTGALQPVDHPRGIRLGVAQIDADRCVAVAGDACSACFDGCPFQHRAIRLEGDPLRPVVSPTICTGCGVCVYLCPEDAVAIAPVQEPGALAPAPTHRTHSPGGSP